MPRISERDIELIRTDALPEPHQSPFYVPRTSNVLAKEAPPKLEPLIYVANGRALGQRLTRPLKSSPKKRKGPATADDPSTYFMEYVPSESPTKVRCNTAAAKRSNQWRQWTHDVIPKLVPVFMRLWHDTQSLRHSEGLELRETTLCSCKTRTLRIAVVHMTLIEEIRLIVCRCQSAPEQLLHAGLFPCSPTHPSLAIDIGLLDFVMRLFVNIPPNNTAICHTLEGFLGSRGYKLTTKDTLRIRFGNTLDWYTSLRGAVTAATEKLLTLARNIIRGDEIHPPPDEAPSNLRASDAESNSQEFPPPSTPLPPPSTPVVPPPSTPVVPPPSTPVVPPPSTPVVPPPSTPVVPPPSTPVVPPPSTPVVPPPSTPVVPPPSTPVVPPPSTPVVPPPSTPVVPPPSTPVAGSSRAPPPVTPVGRKAKRARDADDFPQKKATNPFPDPPPLARVTDYLYGRCPACFGALKHDPTQLVDVMMLWVPEATADQMGAYVEDARPTKIPTSKQPRVEEEEDGYDGNMKVPRSALDGCEASFKAADEKREKASTKFFDDTGIMALLCRHDRVLWLVNMRSAGEKQYYALVLSELLFQNLPLDIVVGALYDVACGLQRACIKWDFLGRYFPRLRWAVSVFHAYGHVWPCQVIYHPLKCRGFGFTNGEGCERTIDSQVEHADKASLSRLGSWLLRRTYHCEEKLRDALAQLKACQKDEDELRAQWENQVATQTKPLKRRSKTAGEAAVEEIILLRRRVDTLTKTVQDLQDCIADTDSTAQEFIHAESKITGARAALQKEKAKVNRLEQQLGITDAVAVRKLTHINYYTTRMNARILWERILSRLRGRKFELDVIERSHAGEAIKRREGSMLTQVKPYNKLCGEISTLIAAKKAPKHSVAPKPMPLKGLYQLDVDDEIWQEVGLNDAEDRPAPWITDDNVRSGIRAMLQRDRCQEEAPRLLRERRHLQIWFSEEWEAVARMIDMTEGAMQYTFELRRKELLELCVIWRKLLDSIPCDEPDLPPWGPTDEEIRNCRIDGFAASYANVDENPDESDEDWDEDEEQEDDDLFQVLEAVERADNHREAKGEQSVRWDDEDVFT
ncbi:hypothetical protein K438DRAFT_1910421 [Mycena galopus ATCC 62051]|nr:hypothetical protein K438DRAFT_1910421 [Mycena galopus ATCC 62051]